MLALDNRGIRTYPDRTIEEALQLMDNSPIGVSQIDRNFWAGRRVFVTGHTGFKGAWLCMWLRALGARVHGYALAPQDRPNLFEVARIAEINESSVFADIRDEGALAAALRRAEPEILFHMAAQSLVRRSYREPIETVSTNVLGTAMVLDQARRAPRLRAIVNVTSDKCYENDGSGRPHVESDPMGGHDPYSASKGAAELIAAAFRRSFFSQGSCRLASVRAGNVIGGGDWAEDRLAPDFFRALERGAPMTIRSPAALRPWQHVLEPLSGYILLAQALAGAMAEEPDGDWNFGPDEDSVKPVQWVTGYLADRFGGSIEIDAGPHPHEAAALRLDCGKARRRLGWRPQWPLAVALDRTGEWILAHRDGQDMQKFSIGQIHAYPGSGLD